MYHVGRVDSFLGFEKEDNSLDAYICKLSIIILIWYFKFENKNTVKNGI